MTSYSLTRALCEDKKLVLACAVALANIGTLLALIWVANR